LTPIWQPNPAYGLEIPDITTIIDSPDVVLSDPSLELQQLGFIYTQNTPSATWTISHNLTFHPNVTVVDSSGSIVEGEISYPNPATVLLTFAAAFSGNAYLS
jgi:hypothetical protein